MNETIRLISSRRTAHCFLPRPVPDELIGAALDCAVRAPNHKLTNPWRFTRVGPESRRAIVDLGVALKTANAAMSEAQKGKVRSKLASSPELFVVRQVISSDEARRREDYAACACAIQNFVLALWSEGVSAKWSTGGVTSHPTTYEIAGVNPSAEEIIGFVWVGYADEQPETPRVPVGQIFDSIP